MRKAIVYDVKDIAHIYGIFHRNQFIISSKATACLTINDFAVQAEMVEVETCTDVGNIPWIFHYCL